MRKPLAAVTALASSLVMVGVLAAPTAHAKDHSVSWGTKNPSVSELWFLGINGVAGPDAATTEVVKATISEVGSKLGFVVQVAKLGTTYTSPGWFTTIYFNIKDQQFAVTAEREPYGDSCYVANAMDVPPGPVPVLVSTLPDSHFSPTCKFDAKSNTTSVSFPAANLAAAAKALGLTGGPGTRLTKLDAQGGRQYVPTAYGFANTTNDVPAPKNLVFVV